MLDLDYLEFCLDKAKWCIKKSTEPEISAIAWLRTFESHLDNEIKTLY